MADTSETSSDKGEAIAAAPKFCPICGATMSQEMRYGILCWVCPECDFTDPV